MQTDMSDLSVIVSNEDEDNQNTSSPPMRTDVFYVIGDTFFVHNICPSISFFGKDVSSQTSDEVTAACEIMMFIDNTITILDSRFANEYLKELSVVYLNKGAPLFRNVPDRYGNFLDIQHGLVVAWEENATTFRFLSLRNKEDIKENKALDKKKSGIDAVTLIYTYILSSYEHLPDLRQTANNIARKYLNEIKEVSNN